MKYKLYKKGNLYHIETDTKHYMFLHEIDQSNMIEYLEKGLLIARVSGKTTYFNNGARLTDCTPTGSTEKAYCLKDGHMTTNDSKYIKKYLDVIERGIK